MCVIVVSKNGVVPSESDMRKMETNNHDGIGITWREKPKQAARYERGITFEEMLGIIERIADKKWPYVLHFRFATVGGISRRLCHPYPITTNQQTLFQLSGEHPYLLAHNGHWSNWDQDISVPVRKYRRGEWTDSAAIAYIAASRRVIVVPNGQKVATLHWDEGVKTFGYFVERRGIQYSNVGWDHDYYTPSHRNTIAGYRSGYGDHWDAYYDRSASHFASNIFECEHKHLAVCEDCMPTRNGLPIELLPEGRRDKQGNIARFTHRANGIPKGVQWHGCQHHDHWHCGECDKHDCVAARKEWKELVESGANEDVCKIASEQQQPVAATSDAHGHPIADSSNSLQVLMKGKDWLPVGSDCTTPQMCQDYPCRHCLTTRRIAGTKLSRLPDAEARLADRRDRTLRLVPLNQGVEIAPQCLHGVSMKKECVRCEKGEGINGTAVGVMLDGNGPHRVN